MTLLDSKSREQFLTAYNPDAQRRFCNKDICYFGNTPTIADLKRTYGNNMPVMWLLPQLYNLSEYCGCREKLQGRPIEECATVIAQEYYYLKVSELMFFFYQFKAGRYRHFYGAVDPLVITTSLREFVRERNIAYDEHEKAERLKSYAEAAKNAITYKEYLEAKKTPQTK